MVASPTSFSRVRLDAPEGFLPGLTAFYAERLELGCSAGDRTMFAVGESELEFQPVDGSPFYHIALLVPGDRFDAARSWAAARTELLPDRETGSEVFDFTNWNAQACYFHDPAGSIVELIAHRDVGEAAGTGPFEAGELLGVSEVGIVGDPPALAEALRRELGLELWDGTVDGETRLAFVGDKARTLILCRAGRPWLPTGRPAEAHPVEVVLGGGPAGEVSFGGSGVVRRG